MRAASTNAPPSVNAAAQTAVDWDTWERFATRVETAIDSGAYSEADLERLRGQVIDWRAQLLQAQRSNNSTRVATLREQMAALGPAPAEGKTEAEDVAGRRQELTEELAKEQAPVLRAVEAWGRADGIVSEIDKTLRERQTTALRRLSPSPLMPSSWHAALTDLSTIWRGIRADTRERTVEGPALSPLLVLAALIAVLAVTFLWGRRWLNRLRVQLSGRVSARAQSPVMLVGSLVRIVLPLAGLYLLARAIDATGIIGPWGRPLLVALPPAGIVFLTGRWIARQTFAADGAQPSPLMFPQAQRERAGRQGIFLAAAVGLHQLLASAGVPLSGFRSAASDATRPWMPFQMSEAAAGVLHLPLMLLGAATLWRLGSVLRKAQKLSRIEPPPYRLKIAWLLGQGARIVAVAAPAFALAGYVAGANATLWPMAITLGLAGLVLLLQQLMADLWTIIRGDDDAANGLVPVLIGFALIVASIPILALIWGARVSELTELWTRIGQGISLGGVRLSPRAVLTFLIVFALGYVTTRGVQGGLRNSVLPKTRIESGAQAALVAGIGYVGIFTAALLAIISAGIDLSSLAIVAGALSVGIGFGLQNIVSNFVSGVILLIERPIAVGDWIAVGNAQGYVRRISVRATAIQTFDRSTIIVPNSDLISQEVTNWTRGSLSGRIIIKVGVSYGSDTRKVAAVLHDIAEAQPTVLIDPAPAILFTGFGKDSLDFEMRVILSDINAGLTVGSEIRHQIRERFLEEGIEVPFAQLEVSLTGREVLQGQPGGSWPAPHVDRPQGGPEPDLDPRIARSTAGGLEGMSGGDGDGDGGDGSGGDR